MSKESYAAREAKFEDGLQNVMTGLGGETDKSTYNRWNNEGSAKNSDHTQLTARFREDWIAQKVCTIIPQDMTRRWRNINTKEGIQADKNFGIRNKFREAYKWATIS